MMCRLVVLATLACAVSSVSALSFHNSKRADTAPYTWDTTTYTQVIDHFNFQIDPCITKQNTWEQRYLYNLTHWTNKSSPIFMYAGNEGDIELFAENSGFMWELAAQPQFGAALLFPEHRYYGKSIPVQPVDAQDTSYLQFLTSEQALADYAVFIQDWKIRNQATGPVIVFGGSYGGMLAAWMRIKYPHLVAGAIAASAPIWQFTNLTSPYTFNQIVTSTFHQANTHCDGGIFKAWKAIHHYTEDPAKRGELKKIFHLCDDITGTPFDAAETLINWIAGNLNSLAMGDYPYPSSFLGDMPGKPVNYACTHFTADNMTDAQLLEALFFVQQTALGDWRNNDTTKCYSLSVTGPPTLADAGGWNYQSCNEMIMPIGQYGNGEYGNETQYDMYEYAPWNLTAIIQGCQQQFPGVQPRPFWINTNWPATEEQLKFASNIFFSNGNLDPWSGGGVAHNISLDNDVVAYWVDGGAHHLDLRASNVLDNSTNVAWVRDQERSYISKWIDHNRDSPIRFTTATADSLPASYNGGFAACTPKSSQLATKWVAFISVISTLAAVVASYYIYMRWFATKPTPLSVNADYQAVDN